MLRRYAAGASALLLVLSGVGAVIAAGRPDGPEPIDFSTQGAGALADWQDLTGLSALLPCPDSPATLGAGTTSADLNALLLAWETAGATTPCSAVLTFTAPTATTYTLDKAYGMKGGLVLDGSPSGGVTLLAATNKNHFKFTAGASLAVQGLTFKGGYPNSGVYTTSGGAIDFAYGGSLRVVSCIFEGNQAESGGAIQTSLSGPATIVASMFRNNDGDRSDNGYNGGAIYAYSTNLTISDSTFIGNTAGYWGGALFLSGTAIYTITRSHFEDNVVYDNFGGAVSVYNYYEPPLTAGFLDCVFVNNSQHAVYNEDEYTDKNTIYFERCTFQDNNPIDIYAYDPFTCLSSCPATTEPPNQCSCALTAAPTMAPTAYTSPFSFLAAEGKVCEPEDMPGGGGRRRRNLKSAPDDSEAAMPAQQKKTHRLTLTNPNPESCYEACKALYAPDNEEFVYNMYSDAGTGDILCTCCRDCAESRAVFGAEVYGTCVTGPAYYTGLTAKASRRKARPKSVIRYRVRVRPTAQASQPYILQVALPPGTIYLEGRATGLRAPPMVTTGGDATTLVTWSSVNPKKNPAGTKPMPRDFIVKTRIDKAVAKGITLVFAGTLYQPNQLTNNGTVCGRAANDVMITVK